MVKVINDIIINPVKSRLFYKNNLGEKCVIVRFDGGIASQIAFYTLVKYYEEKGYKVKVDLSWFDECGMDINNKFARNFDLPKAFKLKNLEIATDEEIKYYIDNFYLKSKIYQLATPPSYVGRYYTYTKLLKKYRKDFIKIFTPELDANNELWLSKIQFQPSCAIHVRRGDLSNCKFSYYGKTATAEYFINAIAFIKNKNPETKFFFFSDEVDWIKSEIVPKLQDISYEIVDCNGSDKGYLDLYLISKCNSFISSIGSLAKFGALLSKNLEGAYFIVSKDDRNYTCINALTGAKIVKIKNS